MREVTHVLADTGYFSAEADRMRPVALEWSLVTLAYNFRRLARLIPAATTRCHGDFALQTA